MWADFTPVFKEIPSMEEAAEIFDRMIDRGIYIPYSKGFNGTDPKYFRIVYSVSENYLAEAMARLTNFVTEYKAAQLISE